MDQPQTPGMQGLARESRPDWHAAGPQAVNGIANQRMADSRHVNTDLMGSTGLQCAFDQGAIDETLDDPVVRSCRFTVLNHRHLRALRRMATDGKIDGPAAFKIAAHQRVVVAFDRARLQLPHQIGLRFQRARHHHQSAGVLVQAMDDTGARHPVEFGRVVEQGVLKRPGPIASPRMDDESGRLVDHDQVIVLEDDVERDILRRRGKSILVGRFGDAEGLSSPKFVLGFRQRLAAETHPALAYPVLQAAARMLRT